MYRVSSDDEQLSAICVRYTLISILILKEYFYYETTQRE